MKLYIAEVLDNNDPDQLGRVQIYCAPIHHNIKKNSADLLPWAQSASCFTSNIPHIGEFWWIWFEKEEFYQNPFYLSPVNFSALNGHNKTIGSITSAYPDVKYFWLPNEVAIGLSSKDDNAEISIHHPNAEIYIEKDGHMTITASGGDNTITMDANGIIVNDNANSNTITLDSNGILIVDANSNEITCDSNGIKLSGGNAFEVGGTVVPDGTGPLCGLPNCLFTGASQTGKVSQGI